MIKLTYNNITETLDAGFCWVDEFTKASQNKVQLLKWLLPQDGQSSALVQESARSGGQTMTLADENGPGWMLRGQLDVLQAWADITPSVTVLIEMDGRTDVEAIFFNASGPAIEARPVLWKEPPDPADPYWVTLHCLKV